MAESLRIETGAGSHVTARPYYPSDAQPTLATWVLAHGAGANQSSPFMVEFATALAHRGVLVVTFNFAYMEQHRRVPDRAEALEDCYQKVLRYVQEQVSRPGAATFIGGKSLGGRIASHLAADDELARRIRGLILLGYPLHPPGKPERERSAHFPRIRVPSLFVQGSRDAFGTPEELRPRLNQLGAPSQLWVVEGGDHSFKVAKNSPVPQKQVYELAEQRIAEWIRQTLE